MKINNFKYIILALVTWGLQGCDHFLDIKPKGYTIPEYFDDYEKLMSSDDFNFSGEVYTNFMTDDIHLADKTVSRELSYDNKSDDEKKLYTFAHGQIFQAGTTDRFWNGCYSRIFTLNAIINNIEQVPDGKESDRKRLKAEALVARAFEYLNLVNGYAKHYNSATAAEDYGVPLVLSEDINKSYKRNSVAEVYQRIEEDLKEAIPNLRTITPNLFRASKLAGHALLARTYLYMGKYKEAGIQADSVLKGNNTLVDMKIYKLQNGTWDRIYNPNVETSDKAYRYPQTVDSPESIFVRMSRYAYNYALCASESLLETFEKELPAQAVDQRRHLMYATDSINRGRNWEYFRGVTAYAPYLQTNLGMSTPEIYLISAECEARVGSLGKAMERLNALRDMRIIDNTPLNITDKDEALRVILDERRRELTFAGLYRSVDLKRIEDKFKSPITHSADGESWTLPINDNRLILPVPNTILDHNPNMPQYER